MHTWKPEILIHRQIILPWSWMSLQSASSTNVNVTFEQFVVIFFFAASTEFYVSSRCHLKMSFEFWRTNVLMTKTEQFHFAVILMLHFMFSFLSTLFRLTKSLWMDLMTKCLIRWSELKEGKVVLEAWLWVRGQIHRGEWFRALDAPRNHCL